MEDTARSEKGILDRPLFSGGKISWWHVAYVGIILFVLFTRFWDLGSRGYSHDESIHAWESWKLITGQGYRHNPVYHGPFLYHFTALLFALFGDTDFTARLGAALFGVALTVMPLFFRRWLGTKGVIATTLFMAISPVMMDRSRFLRHDPFVALFNLMLFLGIMRYLAERKTRDLYLVAAALALGLTAKETTFITYFIFGTFLFLFWGVHWVRDRRLTWRQMTTLPVFDLMVAMGTLILPFASAFPIALLGQDPIDYNTGLWLKGLVFVGMVLMGVLIGYLWNWRRWLTCAGIFWGICVPLFTTLFSNPVDGFATGTVGQLGYWLSQHEVARGNQPWYYYLFVLPLYEFLPLTVGLGGLVFYARRGEPDAVPQAIEGDQALKIPFVGMLLYWFAVCFVMYSWAGEKMPWLTMHMALPLHLFAGWSMARLLNADWAAIKAKGGLVLLLLGPVFVYLVVRVLTTTPMPGLTVAAQSQWAELIVILLALGAVAGLSVPILGRLSTRDGLRMGALSVLVLLSFMTVRSAWMACFTNANDATEFLVYAHGTPDTAFVTDELEDISRRLTGGLYLDVAYDSASSWPFEWYLRDFENRRFFGDTLGAPTDAEAVILGAENEAANRAFLGNNYIRTEYRLIWWPHQDFYFGATLSGLWSALRDPVQRQEIKDVLLHREYARSLEDWYLVSKFSLYLRRDVAAQLWDLGPESITAEDLPGDEYIDKWGQVSARAAWGGANVLSSPKDLALDGQGYVYVADGGSNRILVLDQTGQTVRQIGGPEGTEGALSEPWGVAVGPNGDVYVADTWNHRVAVFGSDGTLTRSWGVFGSADAQGSGNLLYGPRDVAVDAQGNVYVTDTGNKRVIKYDSAGNVQAILGGAGSSEGQFQEPCGIALAADGTLYVADTWNQRVQVFDANLNYLRQWPIYAWQGASVVNKPYLAVDTEQNVYVTDPEGYRVLQFSREGVLERVWGQYGTDLSSMNLPTGIVVDDSGDIYVADAGNGRVMVFSVPEEG